MTILIHLFANASICALSILVQLKDLGKLGEQAELAECLYIMHTTSSMSLSKFGLLL